MDEHDQHKPLLGVTITSREIYDGIVRLTGRVDVLIETVRQNTAQVMDHESRLRTLERARWPLPAAALLLSVTALVLPLIVR